MFKRDKQLVAISRGKFSRVALCHNHPWLSWAMLTVLPALLVLLIATSVNLLTTVKLMEDSGRMIRNVTLALSVGLALGYMLVEDAIKTLEKSSPSDANCLVSRQLRERWLDNLHFYALPNSQENRTQLFVFLAHSVATHGARIERTQDPKTIENFVAAAIHGIRDQQTK